MTDLAEVATIEAQARAVAGVPAPSVLPGPAPAERRGDGHRREGVAHCVVESPGKQVDVLAEIDGLMERRVKSGPALPAPKK